MTKKVYVTSHNDAENLTLGTTPVESGVSLEKSSEQLQIGSLNQLSHDLPPVPNEDMDYLRERSAVSVPSPWAAVITFDLFFMESVEKEGNAFGILSTQAVKSWRSLLSLTALSSLMGFDLKLEPIDLAAPEIKNENDKKFFDTLLDVKPYSNIFGNDECWNKFVFLNAYGTHLGILSNSLLVCPAYSYKPDRVISFLEKRGLMIEKSDSNYDFDDPIRFIAKNEIYFLFMRGWLNALKTAVVNLTGSDSLRNIVVNKTDCFVKDLEAAISKEIKAKVDLLEEQGFLQFEVNLINPVNDIAELMDSITPVFDFSIPYLVEAIKSINYDLYFLDKLGQEYLRIYQNPKFKKINLRRSDEYFVADDVFLDKISLVDCKSANRDFSFDKDTWIEIAKTEESYTKYYYILWPLKKKIFDYMSAFEIRKLLHHKANSDESITVKLMLSFENGDSFFIERTYNKENQIEIFELDVPYLAIWPYVSIINDQKQNIWNEYFVYSASEREKVCQFKFDDGLEPSIGTELDMATDLDKQRSVNSYQRLPTYIRLYNREADGYILLSPPPKLRKGLNKFDVGLDFGTSATTAFFKDPDTGAQPEFIRFGMTYSLIKSADKYVEFPADISTDNMLRIIVCPANLKGDNKDFFIPDKYFERSAYPSIYQINSSQSKFQSLMGYPLLNGNILFETNKTLFGNPSINHDLKWGIKPSEKRSLYCYLGQMMLNIVLVLVQRGAAEINWRFSYPTSLPQDNLISYKKLTRTIIGHITERNGIKSTMMDGNALYPESIVSAKYFESIARGTVYGCIDIGGGSSDMSFWQKKGDNTPENLVQVSVNFASRKIFLPAICELIIAPEQLLSEDGAESNLTDLQKTISAFSVSYKEAIEKAKKSIKSNPTNRDIEFREFCLEMEPAVFKFSREFQELVDFLLDQSDSGYIKFEKKLAFGFYAILHYSLETFNIVKSRLKTVVNSVEIYLAGNGSRLYNWIKEFYLESILDSLYKEFGIRMELRFLGDSNLKTESAKGLITMRGVPESIFKNTERMPNGENLTLVLNTQEEKEVSSDDDLLNFDMAEDWKNYFQDHESSNIREVLINPELENIKAFVQKFNEEVMQNRIMKMELSETDWVIKQL